MPDNILQIDLHHYAHGIGLPPVLKGVKLSLEGGRPYLVLGRSGAGKSTLLSALLPDVPGVMSGEILYRSDLRELSAREACERGWVGWMSQSPALLPWRSIRCNLRLPSQLNPNLSNPNESELLEMMDAVALPREVLGLYPHQLSFGMKQRISFARAVIYKPRFLMLDEVYTGLDVATVNVVEKYLAEYTRSTAAVALVVTHNIEVAQRSAHGLLFVDSGGGVDVLPSSMSHPEVVARFDAELKKF